MILVDSSVWIDFFRGRSERDFNQVRKTPDVFEFVELGGFDIAVKAAKNFRALRALGFTMRRTIDTIIATKCIEAGYTLLHAARDFHPFRPHLGLRVAYSEA